jgi:hypothetical protein
MPEKLGNAPQSEVEKTEIKEQNWQKTEIDPLKAL